LVDVKLTKNELREQQIKLSQLQRYLPTLRLKKSMLQTEVHNARVEVGDLVKDYQCLRGVVEGYSSLFSEYTAVDPEHAAKVNSIVKSYENIAGVEIPYYKDVIFENLSYSLFETPPWVDGAVEGMRGMVEGKIRVFIGEEKVQALGKELREVSIRVNLFEKVLIPRSIEDIRKIKVFLGDQELAAVAQAKVAKNKIEANKRHSSYDN